MCSYFRLYIFGLAFALLVLSALPVNCSGVATSTSSSCWKMASFVKNVMVNKKENILAELDLKFLSDFATCIKEIYKLYKEFDWAEVEKNIPGFIMSFMNKVEFEIAKNPSMVGIPIKAGVLFISSHLFFKTARLYDRAVKLQIDSDVYRKEFEYLRTTKIQPVLGQIDRDILPLLGGLNVGTSMVLTMQAIARLGYHNSELAALLQKVQKDYVEAHNNKVSSAGYSLGNGILCIGSFLIGQPQLALIPCGGAMLSISSFLSYDYTAQQLHALITDAEQLSNNIDHYLTVLKGKFVFEIVIFSAVLVIAVTILFSIILVITVFVLIVFFWILGHMMH